MNEIGVTELDIANKAKFAKINLGAFVTEYSRVWKSKMRVFARDHFASCFGIAVFKARDPTSDITDIQLMARTEEETSFSNILPVLFGDRMGLLGEPSGDVHGSFVLFLARMMVSIRKYSFFGVRHFSLIDISWFLSEVEQHYREELVVIDRTKK
jgi:hypothetical protein